MTRFGLERPDGLSEFLGMRWLDAATVTLRIRPDLLNPGGLLSGAVTYTLVDYGMAALLWSVRNPGESVATLNISINYVVTATDGKLICRTTLDRRNRTVAIMRSAVHHADGRLIANAIGSYSIIAPRPPSAAAAL